MPARRLGEGRNGTDASGTVDFYRYYLPSARIFASTSRMDSPTTESRTFLKAKPLAGRIGVCPRTIKRWGYSGRIAEFKLTPRCTVYDESEVIRFVISARTVTAN